MDISVIVPIYGVEKYIEKCYEGVSCYGYLDKNNLRDKELYYKLLFSAKVMVNHTANWGGYSSIIEGLYYGCPVLVSKYDDFVSEFGDSIDFGGYTSSETLEIDIKHILQNNNYESMCRNGHNRVSNYTWDNYTTEFLSTVNRHLKLDL